jgi:ApbE superfamily uncharacterized protein (UPF0280 family)
LPVAANKAAAVGNMAALAGTVDALEGDQSAALRALTVIQGLPPL